MLLHIFKCNINLFYFFILNDWTVALLIFSLNVKLEFQPLPLGANPLFGQFSSPSWSALTSFPLAFSFLIRSVLHDFKTFHQSKSLSFCLPLSLSHSQYFPHVFVHHVGDADSWNDLEEVGCDAAVQTHHTLLSHDATEQREHGELRATFHRC